MNEKRALLGQMVKDFAFAVSRLYETVYYEGEIIIPSKLSENNDERKISIKIDLKLN